MRLAHISTNVIKVVENKWKSIDCIIVTRVNKLGYNVPFFKQETHLKIIKTSDNERSLKICLIHTLIKKNNLF